MPKTTVEKIKEVLDRFAPPSLALDYDHVGLTLGSLRTQVNGVLVCLDVTTDVLNKAIESGCNLIVSHHPLLFGGTYCIDTDSRIGAIIERALKNGITILAYHTNLDMAVGGINHRLAELFDCEILTDAPSEGVLARLRRPLELDALGRKISDALGDRSVKVCGDGHKIIERLFIVSGAGGGSRELTDFAMSNADCFVTGEVKHHIYLDIAASECCIIEFSHYYSEIVACDVLFDCIKSAFADLKVVIDKDVSPFRTLEEV